MKPSVVTWSCLQWRAVFVYRPYSFDGGKHLIFKIQATSFSSGHNNSLFRKKLPSSSQGLPYLLLHKEASWLVAWKIHVSSWHWDIYSLGLC